MRGIRIWGKRQPALERAARRIAARDILPLLASLARLDALAKGIGRGDAWDAVVAIALALCGKPAPVPS
jgi:DNA polymerase III subunit delta